MAILRLIGLRAVCSVAIVLVASMPALAQEPSVADPPVAAARPPAAAADSASGSEALAAPTAPVDAADAEAAPTEPSPGQPVGSVGSAGRAAPAPPPGPVLDGDEATVDAAEVEPISAPIDCAFCEAFAGQAADSKIVYHLQRIDVRGNTTRAHIIESIVRLKKGDELDPNDPAIALTRWRLMATGWFDDVRLSLEKGRERGWVVLVVEVTERNTLVIERVVAGLSRVVASSDMRKDELRPYAGLGITDVNLFGLGIELSGAVVVSKLQQGFQMRYHDRHIGAAGGFSLRGRVFHNYAREFFGRRPVVFDIIDCPPVDPELPEDEQEQCDEDVKRRRAVVIYKRTGLGFGTGHGIKGNLRYTLDWLGERVDVETKPLAANTQRGTRSTDREPIDFHIEDEISYVSSLRLGFIFDTRDHPTLPGGGSLMRASGQLSTPLLGSDYAFTRFDVNYRKFLTLPWGHGLSLGVFAGTVFGDAPFFYLFYAADLSDLLPSRQLELNLDHRRTHNLLGTSIGEMDKEELAGRVDFEYRLPLYKGGKTVRGMHMYVGGGLFMLSRRNDLSIAIPGYEGMQRVPVDVTFDVGVVADTTLGMVKIGFSTLIGFLPDLGQDNR